MRITALKELAELLANDCGDCETCNGMFTKSMHDDLECELARLTDQEREQVTAELVCPPRNPR